MLPCAEEETLPKWVFRQDSDPKHTSNRSTSRLQTKMIEVMELPAQSPDLNPSENSWGDGKSAVSEAKPKNSQELGCQKSVDSMRRN